MRRRGTSLRARPIGKQLSASGNESPPRRRVLGRALGRLQRGVVRSALAAVATVRALGRLQPTPRTGRRDRGSRPIEAVAFGRALGRLHGWLARRSVAAAAIAGAPVRLREHQVQTSVGREPPRLGAPAIGRALVRLQQRGANDSLDAPSIVQALARLPPCLATASLVRGARPRAAPVSARALVRMRRELREASIRSNSAAVHSRTMLMSLVITCGWTTMRRSAFRPSSDSRWITWSPLGSSIGSLGGTGV